MKTKWILIGSLIILIAGMLATRAWAQKQNSVQRVPHKPSSMSIFMRQKLGYSQKIIEGITLENYDMVDTNAVHIWTMAQKNIFQVFKNPVYAEKTSTFQSDIAVLTEAARAKNTADVLKAYMKVTSDCVDCHQNFRRDQFVRNNLKMAGASK